MGPWGLLRIKEIDGELVGAEIGMTTWFRPTSPTDANEWIAYYDRNAIHATNVGGRCGNSKAPPGFAQVWARTSSRDNNQTTKICIPVDNKGNKLEGVTKVTEYDPVVCLTETWEP